jgi:hypothetical protein
MKIRESLSIIFFILLFSANTVARDTVYYYGANGRSAENQEDARISKKVKMVTRSCYRVKVMKRAGDSWELTRKDRIRTGEDGVQKIWRNEQTFFPRIIQRSMKKLHEDLYYFEEVKSGKITREGFSKSTIPLHLEGKIIEYYPSGKVKSESDYSDNMLLSNRNYNPDGSEYIHNVFYSVDELPSYLFGPKVFRDFVMARIAEVELPVHEINDEVVIGAVVMETGELTGIRVLKGKIPSVNSFLAETMALLPGNWKPAQLNGETVRYLLEIPFNFKNDFSQFQFLEFSKDGQQLFWGL